jgi:monodehydroascorbate reductase (NADH)
VVDSTFAASGVDVPPKSVYAVGDIATFPLSDFSGRKTPSRVEHVEHARFSAAHCAAAVLDESFETPYAYLPFFYSRVFEQKDQSRAVSWAFWGFAPDDAAAVLVGDFAPAFAAFWVADGRVAGVMVESCSEALREVAKRAARTRVQVDIEALRKCATPEEALDLVKAE